MGEKTNAVDVADASNLCLSQNTPSASPIIRRLLDNPRVESHLDLPSSSVASIPFFESAIVSGGLHFTATKADISFSIRTPLSGKYQFL